jgi:hypothetical protein
VASSPCIRIGCYEGSLVLCEDGTIETTVTPAAIAHGLAAVSRFGGQTRLPYSVGEHSVRLSWLLADQCSECDPALQCAALIHDAPEAFGVGDVNTFIKRRYGLEGLRELDRTMTVAFWDSLCRDRFGGLDWSDVEQPVHDLDKWIGHYEARHFGFYIPPELQFNPDKYRAWPIIPEHWSHQCTKEIWLDQWANLMSTTVAGIKATTTTAEIAERRSGD